ncbi:MAG: phosphate acetyltransferase [Oleiphilaceae bacterium]|nr:phosphate acetyltransferase [Oleiphilaceae bacterium]
MSKSFFIAPTALHSGLTSVCLGLVRALDKIGVRVAFFKPIAPLGVDGQEIDESVHFGRSISRQPSPDPIPLAEAQRYLSKGDQGLLMEKVIENYQQVVKDADVVIVEGLVPDRNEPYTVRLNIDIANNLDAEVILVASPRTMSPKELDEHLQLAAGLFASTEDPDVLGVILNKTGGPKKHAEHSMYLSETDLPEISDTPDYRGACTIFSEQFRLLGQIPWDERLCAPRMVDLVNSLGLTVLHEGELAQRRVKNISVCARSVPNLINQLTPGCLIVTPGDRVDVVLAACMAALSGVPLAGILLTGDFKPNDQVMNLCQQALLTGMPLLLSKRDTFHTASALTTMNSEVRSDDIDRMEQVVSVVSEHIDIDWLKTRCDAERATRLSPPAFRYRLSEAARAANKTIILPEGNEPRTICAAAICHQRGLAKCILVGKEKEIHSVAQLQGVTLPPDIGIIDPDAVREKYVAPMVELRKNKGLTPQMALAMLEDNVVLATMMVALDEVDGLVSGAVHTTANTVRPALQLIKTAPHARVVSSVFFMCLPEQVLVYGDCAINPDPNAEELADIAIQSADSALTFGIEPKIAMISYSTGESGSGQDVDKVREATRIAKEKRPDLLIDGPLQYDAAAIESVANKKAPNSPVAGKATVFIFPDLNTGNTTYKAVQRSANVISVGPMLQGLRKPVNDLSRGALIEDIVFTIALTCVQAKQVEDAMNA